MPSDNLIHIVPTGSPDEMTYCGERYRDLRITVVVNRSNCMRCIEVAEEQAANDPDQAPPHGIARPLDGSSIVDATSDYMAVAAAVGLAAQRSGNNLSTADQLGIVATLTDRLGLPSPQQTAQAAAERQRYRLLCRLTAMLRDGCEHRVAVAVEIVRSLGIDPEEARASLGLVQALADVLMIDGPNTSEQVPF